MSAALRLPKYGEVSLSDILFQWHGNGYRLTLLPLKNAEALKDICWHSLLLGTVVARDFPIPQRETEIGVELPFNLMMTLTGTLYPMSDSGGVYFQGHSRLLFPSAISKDGAVQWHLVTSEDRRKGIAPGTIHKYSWAKVKSPQMLANARTFLGHYRSIVIDLGTEKPVAYYRNIRFSGADDEDHGPSVQAPSAITYGTSGMGIFGVQTTTPIAYSKALAQTIAGDGDDYLDVLDFAKERPIIIFDNDPESLQGWMVPALCVIHHMVHSYASHLRGFAGNVPTVALTWDVDATQKALEENWAYELREGSEPMGSKPKLVKDLVMQFWNRIVQRAGNELEARCQKTPEMALQSPKLYGWEYMDLIKENHSRRKQLDFRGD